MRINDNYRDLPGFDNWDLNGKTVLLRVDYNVPLGDDGNILELFRIQKAMPTIIQLSVRGAIPILMSHLEKDKVLKPLTPIYEYIEKEFQIRVIKADGCVGEPARAAVNKAIDLNRKGIPCIVGLANLREEKGEKKNDPEFVKELGKLGSCYINEALACDHRKHGSIIGLPEYFGPGKVAAGYLLRDEINMAICMMNNLQSPKVAIIGGTKSDKLLTVQSLLNDDWIVLLGGKLGYMVARCNGVVTTGEKPDKDFIDEIKSIDFKNPNLVLPEDDSVFEASNSQLKMVDIGPKTKAKFIAHIRKASGIFANGPMGKAENSGYLATKDIYWEIALQQILKIIGGGDTTNIVRSYNIPFNSFTHVSTGGGASLKLYEQGNLVGVDALFKKAA